MPLPNGTQLGSYEITGLLGAGGMGEVYRAHDAKLNRGVAIKVLPTEFAKDPERIARFHREAQAVAALNHPNIAAIHELAESGSEKFLVLELVEGDTLAERLRRGPFQIEDALNVAKQIADAMEAAHEKGVIHRDLKPANVKITPEGKVKVLDFGLAKAMETAPSNVSFSNSPTLSLASTNPGVILGTASYMSPEQAKGFNSDQRSDIFSFGCVVYEMLTGRLAFDGDTVSEILASVLKTEADLNLLPPKLNPRIIEMLRRCLEKNPKRRWHAAADVRVELETILADPRGAVIAEERAATGRPLWRRAIPVVLSAILAGAVAAAATWYLKPADPRPLTRFTVQLPEGQLLTNTGRAVVAISPDGTQIVFVANNRLHLRSMSDLETRPIQGTENLGQVMNPVFSPDGRSIVFFSNDQTLKRIAVTGGAAVTICQAGAPNGMSWGDEGILFGQSNKGIMRVSANGGKPELLVSMKGDDEIVHGPQMLPGGKAFLFTVAQGSAGDRSPSGDRWDKAQIVVQQVPSGERKTIIEGGSEARYVPTGHIVYGQGGTLFAVPFDLDKLAVTSGPTPIVEGVRRSGPSPGLGTAHYSFSRTGSLVYVPGPVSSSVTTSSSLAMADRKSGLELLKLPPNSYYAPRVSPNGKEIAFGTENGKEAIVWIYDLAGTSSMRRLTFGGANRYPVWSSDGKRVAFQSDREGDLGIFWQPADGSGTAERLTKPERGVAHIPESWSRDGQRIAFTVAKGTDEDVWIFSIQDKKADPFAALPGSRQASPYFSPDGRWLAYHSNETGRALVYVEPFPKTGAKYQISSSGFPVWSPDGKEIALNYSATDWRITSIKTQPGFTFSEPVLLPLKISRQNPLTAVRNYDIMPDGQRFIGIVNGDVNESGTPSAPQIQVVLHWFEDLKQRVPRP